MLIVRSPKRRHTALSGQAGATTAEYALLVGFIATVIVGVVGLIGLQLIPEFQSALGGP
jgi:Flp pilus assembly pilin Flp